jgi:hypothetical protein
VQKDHPNQGQKRDRLSHHVRHDKLKITTEQIRNGKAQQHAQDFHGYYPPGDRWDPYLNGGHERIRGYHHSIGVVDQWQYSVFALVASVLLMIALCLHLISDGANERRKHKYASRSRRETPSRMQKKTDVWIPDVDEKRQKKEQQQLDTQASRPLHAFQNPYPARLQQRVPQRIATPDPSPIVVKAVTNAAARPTISGASHLSKGDPFATQSTYMNTSGGGMLYRAPESMVRTPARTNMSSSRLPSPGDALSAHKRTPSRHEHQFNGPSPLRNPLANSNPTTPIYDKPLNQMYASQRAIALESRVSSFGSLVGTDSLDDSGPLDEEAGTPSGKLRYADPLDFGGSASFECSHGSDDVDETERMTGRSKPRPFHGMPPDWTQETPRATNSKSILPSGCLNVTSTRNNDPWHNISLQPPSGDGSLAFASPPAAKRRHNDADESDYRIPFVPHLGPEISAPPASININALRLHQMESGSVPHWAAESFSEAILGNEYSEESSSSSSAVDKIPSNDPRAGIDHKRKSLIDFTNSAASLQGAIDFEKLELIEVIGGGGFGQVWKAKWRGTPVAVKILTGSAQSKHVPRAVLEEFAAEINLLKGMQHPNICLYMGACVVPPNRAIVTELAAHGSLWDALRLPLDSPFTACDGVTHNGWPISLFEPDPRYGTPPSHRYPNQPPVPPKYQWPWVLVKKVAVGVARGMAYLHGGDPPILHRDLKSVRHIRIVSLVIFFAMNPNAVYSIPRMTSYLGQHIAGRKLQSESM